MKAERREDPFESLGDDIMETVFDLLDPWSLQRSSFVSRKWRKMAVEERRWQKFCSDLWKDKAYIPEAIRTRTPSSAAYWSSLRDSTRDVITRDELCSFVWTFRFKHQDLPWMLSHPFWRFMPVLYRRFHPDSTISATADDPIFGRHETVWRFTSAGSEDHSTDVDSQGGSSCTGSQGKKIRVNHWPALTLARRRDWGWQMQNHYVMYQSLHGEEGAKLQVDTKPDEMED